MSLCPVCKEFYGSPETLDQCSRCFTRDPEAMQQIERRNSLILQWKQAARDGDISLLSDIFSSQESPLHQNSRDKMLADVFYEFCSSCRGELVRRCLADDTLRDCILRECEHAIHVFLYKLVENSSVDIGSAMEIVEILTKERTFAKHLSESDMLISLRLKNGAPIIKRLLDLALQGYFIISMESLDAAQYGIWKTAMPGGDPTMQCPPQPRSVQDDIKEALQAQIDRLESEGKYQNLGIFQSIDDLNKLPLHVESFPTPFQYFDGPTPYCTLERDFNLLSMTIRQKSHWWEKVNNDCITSRWYEEAMTQGMSPKLFSLVLQQLKTLALVGRDEKYVLSPVYNVYQSDCILTSSLRECFCVHADRLEKSIAKDYHPGSNDMVVDIVHPSLYPAINGVTEVLPKPVFSLEASWRDNLGYSDRSERVKDSFFRPSRSSFERQHLCWSLSYQWLPAEFYVSQTGQVTINSYINNLHPLLHGEMYPVLENIFAACIPMVEQVLSDSITPPLRLLDPSNYDMYADDEIDIAEMDDDDYEEYYDMRIPLDIPLPDNFPVEEAEKFIYKRVNLKNTHLQVIVKMASIELSPDKPVYRGGSWHVEGMKNERIVCSVIHYYSCDNITESRLSFRQAVEEPDYEQNDTTGLAHRYNLHDEDPLNEYLGYIEAVNGRTVVFPNIFQHRVQPFELADPSRPGHRKILVFFVVDPLIRVLSTAMVPPQQRDWVLYPETLSLLPFFEVCSKYGIPDAILLYIYEFLNLPLSREEAEVYRLRLMEERSRYVDELTDEVFERPFSLCEH